MASPSSEKSYTRRNFVLGVINGSLVNFGMAFVDPYTVLPVFILRLGASNFIVGLASAISGVGWFLPQIFVSRIAESRSRLINIYRSVTVLRVLAWMGVALSISMIDPARLPVYLSLFMGFYLFAHLGAGVAAVPFLEVTGKTIPVTRRGAFFGTRRLIGGVLGVFAGVLVSAILGAPRSSRWMGEEIYAKASVLGGWLHLSGHDFPMNYGILFAIGGALLSLGLIVFCFVGEPPSREVRESRNFFAHLLAGISLLRWDENYRKFYLARIFWQFTAMAFPFYSSYAYKNLHFSENAVGVYVALWVGSGVVSNYLWGKILDTRGNKLVLVITAWLSLIPPVTMLAIDGSSARFLAGNSAALFFLVASTFFVNGFIRSGRVVSNLTYLLEFAPLDRRPLYVGFMNSFTFPFMLSPMLGGLIVEAFSMRVLFSITIIAAVANIVTCLRLKEPRERSDKA